MDLVCINCPLGCHLHAEKVNDKIVVSGNTCPRGEQYAINEMTCPMRTLTTTVKIEGAIHNALPVITNKQIEKDKMFKIMEALKGVKVKAPIKVNDIIVKDICNTGVDIIASRSMKKICG